MSLSPVLFSSAEIVHATPRPFFDPLHAEFGFTLDAAAIRENALCADYFGPDHVDPARRDGLAVDWSGVVWNNPPYRKPEMPCKRACKNKRCAKRGYHSAVYVPGIEDWIEKAADESAAGRCSVVQLIPSRTDAGWWHKQALRAHEIRFVRGRLEFGGLDGAPFPSAVLVFHPWRRPAPEPRITWDTVAA